MADPRQLAASFATALQREFGPRVQSAALFGSAARDEWIEGVSDVNVLILVDDIDAALLARAAPVVRDAVSRGVQPLLMELAEWRRAADVFAIELADMNDTHEPIFGDDPIAVFHADPHILRLQAERELRAKILHLHAGMIFSSDDRARLGQLFTHALPSFLTYLRAALRLAERPVPRASAQLIDAGCALVGADPSVFARVLRARTEQAPLELDLTDPLADEFNTSAEQLAAYIDAYGR